MSQVNLNLEALFVVLAGFVLGIVPAFLFIGFYFGRKVEKEKKALRLKYERQVTALRATLQRMMDRIDTLTGERNQLQQSNKALREAVRDQHEISDSASQKLEETQENLLRMEERVDELQAENLRYEGRMQQAEIHQQRMAAQQQQFVEQITQSQRMRRNLIFAAAQLRETTLSNQALETQLQQTVRADAGDQAVPVAKLDVGLISGLEPVYAQRLHESGIHTIGDLAKQTPARVAHFAGLNSWDDSASWIAEAKIRVAGSSAAQA